MALVVLTDEQRIALQSNERYRNLIQASIGVKATYWYGQDGNSPPGNDHIRWAKSRTLSYRIMAYPLGVDLQSWIHQFSLLSKNNPVYDDSQPYSEDLVIDYMIISSTFEAVMDAVFNLRIVEIPF